MKKYFEEGKQHIAVAWIFLCPKGSHVGSLEVKETLRVKAQWEVSYWR